MESFSFFIWRHSVTCLLFNIFLKMNSSTLNVSVHDWLSYNCFIYLAVGGIKYAAVLLNVKRPSCLLPPGFFCLVLFYLTAAGTGTCVTSPLCFHCLHSCHAASICSAWLVTAFRSSAGPKRALFTHRGRSTPPQTSHTSSN